MAKGHRNFFHRLYHLFSSIGFSVFLFALLAASSLIGTLIPQRSAAVIQTASPLWGKIIVLFSLNDMYHAWWFRLLLLLLAMSLIVCTFERLPGIWKIARKKQKVLDADAIRSLRSVRTFLIELPLEKARDAAKKVFAGKLGESVTDGADAAFIFYAESGRWTRFGVYLVHCSILLLLLGGLLGSLFGFSGRVNIKEGDFAHDIMTRDGKGVIDPGFSIRCDEFSLSFYEDGTPKEYRSTLSLFGKGAKKLATGDILVNHPMRYRGVRIFQSSYGIAEAKNIRIKFIPDKGESVSMPIEMNEIIKDPVKGGELALVQFMDNFVLRGHSMGPTFIGIYIEPDGKENMLRLHQYHPGFDRMNKRGFHMEIEHLDPVYYTGLQVSRDPGVWLVYAGFLLMIPGLWVAFFMSHRQIWVLLEREGEKTLCTLAGTTNRNKAAFEARLSRFEEKLGKNTSLIKKENRS